MIGLDSYLNGTKTTWRGRQWRRIVERLPEFCESQMFRINNQSRRICRGKTVLYLCGPDDFDRGKAHRYGFCDQNLIAIDVNDGNLSNVRTNSKSPVLNIPIEQAIACWPVDWPIDVVIADTCSSAGPLAEKLMLSLICSHAIRPETIVAVNFQRGREPSDSLFSRQKTQVHEWQTTAKHRGEWFFQTLIKILIVASEKDEEVNGIGGRDGIELFFSRMSPITDKYRSRGVWMDSVVFRMSTACCARIYMDSCLGAMAAFDLLKPRMNSLNEDQEERKLKSIAAKAFGVKDKITAMRAVRSRRMNLN